MAIEIQLRGVTKRFGAHRALGPIDLHIASAKTLCLLGPSGCGKSTLLRAVVGLVQPDAGEIRVGDTVVSPATVMGLRRRMGYVIQEGGLFPHLTSRENVSLMARYLGWTPDRIRARITDLSALVRLPDAMLDRYPQALSGGQRQRVGLMRALMLDPEVLLLDEPLGALDPMVRAELQRDLREIFEGLGRTVLMVTHDLREARVLGDEVCLLRDGALVQRGTVDVLERAPANEFVTQFLGAWR